MSNDRLSVLGEMPNSEWDGFSAPIGLYVDLDWWNVTYCDRSGNLDGFRQQTKTLKDGSRISISPPYAEGRSFGYLAQKRFSLEKRPVSYWARSADIANCETVDSLRYNPNLTFNEYWKGYIKGPASNQYGYPVRKRISRRGKILDLTALDSGFVKTLVTKSGFNIYEEVIRSRDEAVYPRTQVISKYALDNGFDGIIYRSVRAFKDVRTEDSLLVLFNESLLENPPQYS